MAKASAKRPRKRARLMRRSDRSRLNAVFGRRLKKLRLQRGLTPLQFYEKSGIDGSNLGKYERGEREPGLSIIMMMAKALEVDHLVLLNFGFDLPEMGPSRASGGL